MPIYEYACDKCGKPFEKMVSFAQADQLPACPQCASKETRKKISTVFSFASAGFGGISASSSDCTPRGGFS